MTCTERCKGRHCRWARLVVYLLLAGTVFGTVANLFVQGDARDGRRSIGPGLACALGRASRSGDEVRVAALTDQLRQLPMSEPLRAALTDVLAEEIAYEDEGHLLLNDRPAAGVLLLEASPPEVRAFLQGAEDRFRFLIYAGGSWQPVRVDVQDPWGLRRLAPAAAKDLRELSGDEGARLAQRFGALYMLSVMQSTDDTAGTLRHLIALATSGSPPMVRGWAVNALRVRAGVRVEELDALDPSVPLEREWISRLTYFVKHNPSQR